MVRTPKEAAKDTVLYLAISIVILGPIVASLFYDWHAEQVTMAMMAILYTAILFGPFALRTRAHWGELRFWLGSLILLGMHCGVLVFLAKQQHITVWLIAPITAIEGATLTFWTKDLTAQPQTTG